MSCAAWDLGALQAAVRDILGFAIEPKTTKTKCGRRRKLSQIDNDTPTCGLCQEAIRQDREEQYDLWAALKNGEIERRKGLS